MNKTIFVLLGAIIIIGSCKKEVGDVPNTNKQLYPLTPGNRWIYVDSFFSNTGNFYGKDTFNLKATAPINFNNQEYTPITDQFDEAIFTVRSTDSNAYILKEPGESLLFNWPMDETQPTITNSYYGDTLTSVIYTKLNTSTNFPSYRIVITQDDRYWNHFRQQESYFTIGMGIISGKDIKRKSDGSFYIYDSFKLITYSFK